MPQKRIRAAGYPRVSDESLKESKTLESQEKEIRRYIEMKGYENETGHMYPEAMTAYMRTFRERPIFTKLLQAAKRGEFDVVIVTEYSRLSRRQVEQAVILDILEKYGVKVESVTEKFEESALGHFMRAVYAFTSEVEREKIYYRTMRGARDRVEEGNLTGQGRPAYGYIYVDTPDYPSARYELNLQVVYVDSESKRWTEGLVVKFIFQCAYTGMSTRSIALTLTQMGIPTQRGKPFWSYTVVHAILTNPLYIGEPMMFRLRRENQKNVPRPLEEQIKIPEGVVPPLVDKDTFLFVQKQLEENKRDSFRNNKHTDQLGLLRGGFARCSVCKGSMHVRYHTYPKHSPHKPEYCCVVKTGNEQEIHHHCIGILIERVDAEAWQKAVTYILNPPLLRAHVEELRTKHTTDTQMASVEDTIFDIKKRLKNLYRLAQEATDDENFSDITALMKDLERQKRDAERILYDVAEEEEINQQLNAALDKFEQWAYKVRPLLSDPTYQPTYEEMRLAIKILGIRCEVFPGDKVKRVKFDVVPPTIADILHTSS